VRFPGATHLVILSRGCATEALNWTRNVMTRIGLTLNEAKTSTKEARTERFDFLGYAFGPHRARTHGGVYLGMSPSHKVARPQQDGYRYVEASGRPVRSLPVSPVRARRRWSHALDG
jgi:hypothetical protein